jgi:hypothetical protein
MIKRPTWILLVILAVVVAAYFLVKNQPPGSSDATPTAPGDQYLISEPDGSLIAIRVSDDQGRVVQVQKDPGGVWVVTQPRPGEADQASAGAAETQVEALLIVTSLDTVLDPGAVGLSAPTATIELTFDGNIEHRLEIGATTSIGSGYYVRMDGSAVYVVSTSGIDSLLRLLDAPPYRPTETPVPTASPSAEALTPASQASATPTP